MQTTTWKKNEVQDPAPSMSAICNQCSNWDEILSADEHERHVKECVTTTKLSDYTNVQKDKEVSSTDSKETIKMMG